ncbi:MAG: hypothetical protein Q9195_006870 [Heterodermia aff. obscurata]
MANPSRTYILAPTRDIPPEGPICLGNIIASPKDPEEKENQNTPRERLGDNQTYNAHKSGWSDIDTARHTVEGGFFAKFLSVFAIGGEASLKHAGSSSTKLSAAYMDTCWFNPTKQYIKESIQDPGVKSYIEENRWRSPVYMITGLMIVRGASASKSAMAEKGIHTQFGVDITAGAPLTVGPKLDLERAEEHNILFDHASDFVLAYRLRKIEVKKGGIVKSEKYTKGALYDSDIQNDVDVSRHCWDDFQIIDEEYAAETANSSLSMIIQEGGGA